MIESDLIERVQNALPNDVTGWCYSASEALYYLAGGKEAGLKPCQSAIWVDERRVSHWWLEDTDGNIYDLTAEQFDFPWPYHTGKGRGFQTKRATATENLLRVVRLADSDTNGSVV